MDRRDFIITICVGATAAMAGLGTTSKTRAGQAPFRYLRPPGARDEAEFLSHCINCGQCGEACPNRCIKFFGPENGIASLDTPYIIPREKGCILCMKCGDVCPTDAINPIPREINAILAGVAMGVAQVDERLCLSFQGKTCGVCYRACPLQDVAITVGRLEQPHVTDKCIGCGLCERSCIQLPQAIRIIPRHAQNSGGA